MNKYLEIEAVREAYDASDVAESTLTVGELIRFLEMYDEDTPVVLSHDGGYTYGAITESRVDTNRW